MELTERPRQCGSCTKCCEGWLFGEAHGTYFQKGRPCHFMGEGCCTIYNHRPETPCQSFRCEWLANPAVPEWMKPDRCNALLRSASHHGIHSWHLTEAGQRLDSRVLAWVITHCLAHKINLIFEVDGGSYKIGGPDFIAAFEHQPEQHP